MKRFVPHVLAAAAAMLLAGWGSAVAAPLDAEIAGLLQSHPRLETARSRIAAAEDAIDRRYAEFLPTINFSSELGHQVTDSPALRTAGQSHFSTNTQSANLSITQNLFRGYRSESQHKRAKIAKILADISLDSVEQNLLFDGVTAYLNVIRRLRLAELSKRNEKIIQEQLFLEDERVIKGSGISVDVLFAKSRLQIAKERRTVAEGEYLSALSVYNRLFNHPANPAAMDVPVIPADQIPKTADEAKAAAAKDNPTLQDSKKAVALAKEGLRLADAPFYPSLDLIGQTIIESDADGVAGARRDASLVLRLNWDLYSGGATMAESAAAREGHRISMSERDDVRRNVNDDVQRSWDRLATSKRRITLLENAVIIAGEVHAARKRLAELGKETIINVLDAQSETFAAEIEAKDATFDGYIAVYRVLLAMGRLGPAVFMAKK